MHGKDRFVMEKGESQIYHRRRYACSSFQKTIRIVLNYAYNTHITVATKKEDHFEDAWHVMVDFLASRHIIIFESICHLRRSTRSKTRAASLYATDVP